MKYRLISAVLLTFYFFSIKAQNEFNVIKDNWMLYSDAPNFLYHHLTGQAIRMLDSRASANLLLKTPEQWKKHQQEVKSKLWKVIGSFPEKTPLNAKITSVVQKKGYRIENLIYESLPGFYVTASLFIPDQLVQNPSPAVLFCSGHSHGVYRLPGYQQPLLNLVMKGFIVLAIDPIGQGERLQYYDPQTKASVIGSSTKEHSYPSAQIFLTAKSVARYFAWDGIRGIDYLISRPEVDPKRIGVHGLSGGGTQTAYISALDERVYASAPAGYITSYRRLLESIGVQDGEQNLYHGISEGIDHLDFLEVRAPKPTLIMATTSDFFSIMGARESYSTAKRTYSLFGKPDNLLITEDDNGHGYTKKNREALYAFFQKHLGLTGSSEEEEVEYVPEQELQKTTTGQLSTSLGGETVFTNYLTETERSITKLDNGRKNPAFMIQAVASAKKLSGYTEPAKNPKPMLTGRIPKDGYVIEKYFVKGEGNYVIPYLYFVPDQSNNKVILYLHPNGKNVEASDEGEIAWFVKRGYTVLAPDLVGIGETGAGDFKGDAYIEGTSYNMWYTAILIGRSIAGIRAGDINLLSRIPGRSMEIYGFARKEMGPVLLHAAAFNPAIKKVALIESYSSYRVIATNRFYNPAFVHSTVAGALTAYDLPDLAGSLAPRTLLIAGVTDELGNNDQTKTAKDMDIVSAYYQSKKAEAQLSIVPGITTDNLRQILGDWSR